MARFAMVLTALLLGCQSLEEPRALSALDDNAFTCEVEPVLIARCGFYACHGSGQRPLRVYGRNRLRLNPPRGHLSTISSALTPEEHEANLASALGFADPGDLEQSLLLMKPLDVDAGGYHHGGKSLYGSRDVFASTDDVDYQAILGWLEGGTRADGCTPREVMEP